MRKERIRKRERKGGWECCNLFGWKFCFCTIFMEIHIKNWLPQPIFSLPKIVSSNVVEAIIGNCNGLPAFTIINPAKGLNSVSCCYFQDSTGLTVVGACLGSTEGSWTFPSFSLLVFVLTNVHFFLVF